jgi:hypothetical protein
MARRPGARLGERDAAAVGVEREDNRASDVFEGQKKMRWCEESQVEWNAHTHSPGKGKSEETTPAERGFILRPAKLLSAKPQQQQHHRGRPSFACNSQYWDCTHARTP